MSKLAEELRKQIDALEEQLKRGTRHGCRNCVFYACGGLGKCGCGCGQVGKERLLHLERLRYLAECADSGEVPDENDTNTDAAGGTDQAGGSR